MVIFRLFLSCLLALALAGCSDARPSSGPPTARIGFGIGSSARASGVDVLAQILYAEPLFGQDWSGRVMPRLVRSWSTTNDGKTLTMHLKTGVMFHDGSPLRAEIVARSLEKHVSTKRVGLQHVTDVRASAEDTITITLSEPDFFLLPALNELMLTHPDNKDVATGPFKLVSRVPIVDVRRFENYHGGTSALGGVTIQTFDTQRSAWAALMRGEVDVVQEVSREHVEFIRGDNVTTYPTVQAYYLALMFNHRHPLLGRVGIRRAIAEAIDRSAIIQQAMRGKGRRADDPIWPFHWAYPTDVPTQAFNPEHAAATLDKAGFPLPTTGRQGEQRKRLSFKCVVYSEDPQFERIARLIQRQLFNIGIDMQIELTTLDTLVNRATAGDYDAFLMQMYSGRAMDFAYRFWKSSEAEARMVNSGYTGADAAFDALRGSFSEEMTKQAVSGVVRRFREDVPAVFLAWTELTRAVSTRFDVGSSGNQDPFFSIWQWQPREAAISQ